MGYPRQIATRLYSSRLLLPTTLIRARSLEDAQTGRPGPDMLNSVMISSALLGTAGALVAAGLGWRIYRVRSYRYNHYNAFHKRFAHLANELDSMTCACHMPSHVPHITLTSAAWPSQISKLPRF